MNTKILLPCVNVAGICLHCGINCPASSSVRTMGNKKLVEKNKQMRLANAKKTIEKLEGKN
jgi:hypothetical protein